MKRAFLRCAPLALAPAMMLSACNEQPEGEPVVTVRLNEEGGNEVIPAPGASETPGNALAAMPSVCSPASFEGIALTHCVADPQTHTINVVYGPKNPSGDQLANQAIAYGNLSALAQNVDASSVAFAMNGGAFSDDLTPRGYLVSAGDRLAELDSGTGDGNFYLKPNGVFFGGAGKWRILTTETFLRTVRDRPQFGTQSGPILVVDGELGGAISKDGNSRAVRNGVGVDSEGKAHFVISNAPLSFGQLARYFRDEVNATDALFLDANSSALWDPASGRMDDGRTGPILVVNRKGE